MKEKFNISGMTCAACVAHVEKAVKKINGTSNINVNLLTNTLTLDIDSQKTDNQSIIDAVQKAGYGATIAQDANTQKNTATNTATVFEENIRDIRRRLIGSLIFIVPLLYISMSHMWGAPIPYLLSPQSNPISFIMTQLLLTLPIVAINRVYYTKGFKSLFNLSPNMDTLIAIGSAAALIYGIFAIYMVGYGLSHRDISLVQSYTTDVYFESTAMILTLISVGKYLEAKSKGKTSEALEKLMKLSPATAIVEENGVEVVRPIEEVHVGDTVIVKPGQTIPVDGIISYGTASIDESAITGESIPVEKSVGSNAIQATINKSGYIKVRATKVGEDTLFAEIIRLVEESGASKAPIAKLADKVSGIFVPIVILLAIVTAIVWLILGQTFEFALSSAIAVLVISCPCALGLATPVTIMVGTGKGAENGILFKSGEALENTHSINCIAFDKTGTITKGKPQVKHYKVYNDTPPDLLLGIAYSLEQRSEHPLAEAIIEYVRSQNIVPIDIDRFESLAGKGLIGYVGNDKYMAGNISFVQTNGVNGVKCDVVKDVEQLTSSGNTVVVFAKNSEIIGLIAIADSIKPTSRQAIDELRRLRIDTVMLTGDNKYVANNIAQEVGIDRAISEVLPQEKERIVATLMAEGKKTAMVGDGINDAPALARADIGIAIGNGTDIAVESADIVLMKNDLLGIVSAIKLSKAVITNIKQNLFWAFFYNIIGIPLAAGALYPIWGLRLTPIFGAAAMSLSSIFVVTNALRLKSFKTYSSKHIKNECNKQMTKKIFRIEGMRCPNCVKHVQNALNKLGVKAEVSLETHSATIEADDIKDADIKKAIEEAGYKVK